MTQEVLTYIIWGILILVFSVLEAVTAQLVSIWFVLGSIGALISALFKAPTLVQVIVFVAVSVIALIITRPIVKKKLTPHIQSTNADRCIGNDAIVIEKIDNINEVGAVKIDGKVWTARSENGEKLEKNCIVTVKQINGVKLIVAPKNI